MNIKKFISNRIIYLGLAAIFEFILYAALFRYVREKSTLIEMFLHIAAVFIVLHIIRTSRHLSSDLMWLVLIMLAPVPGTAIFLMTSADLIKNKTFRAIVKEQKKAYPYLVRTMASCRKWNRNIHLAEHPCHSSHLPVIRSIAIRVMTTIPLAKPDGMSFLKK